VHDDGEVRGLLQFCKQIKVTAVWSPKSDVTPQERQRQFACRDRMLKWVGVYDRLRLVQAPGAEAAAMLKGEQFDAVAMWNHKASQLATEGPLWAAMVRDGGALLGLDHRDINTRRVLNNAVPKWRTLRDGVWLVDVKRNAADAPAGAEPVASEPIGVEGNVSVDGRDAVRRKASESQVSDDAELPQDGGDIDTLASRLVEGVEDGLVQVVAHDPVDSGSVEDDAVHVAAPVVEAEGSELDGVRMAPIAHDAVHAGSAPSRGSKPKAGRSEEEPLTVGDSELHADNVTPLAPKRRGRPPGSKNKARAVA